MKKIILAIGILFSSNQSINAAPIFGLLGQGTPKALAGGTMGCDQGWKWCKFNDVAIANPQIKDLVFSFDVDVKSNKVVIECDILNLKTFGKMITNNIIELTENVPLDVKITKELSTRLKIKGRGLLSLLKGKYAISKKGNTMTISTINVDYVGHVTLLK